MIAEAPKECRCPRPPDLLFVIAFAVAWPAFDYLVCWPAFRRRSALDPAGARRRLWAETVAQQWALVAAGAAIWLSYDRPWSDNGFAPPDG